MQPENLIACAWPLERVGEALAALTKRPTPSSVPPEAELDSCLERLAAHFDIEVEPATLPYSGLAKSLGFAGPALLRIPAGFLVILPGNARSVPLLAPGGKIRRFPAKRVAAALCDEMEAPIAAQVDALLEAAGITTARRGKVRTAIIQQRLASRQIPGCWLLRLPPGASFMLHLRQAGVPRRLGLLAATHLVQYLLFIGSWWVLGVAVLQGRIDRGWLTAWALMLLTIVPCRMIGTWLQGAVAIRGGAALKQRLLAGALSLDPDEIRSEGAGQLLGRVLEAQQVEALALSGGFLALVATIELLLATIVLIAGGIWSEPVLLVVWVAAAFLFARRYLDRNDVWTGARLSMTHDLVEKMVGHRTRLAQERRDNWHTGEDEALEKYLALSRVLDRASAQLTAIVPRGWMLLGVVAIGPAFVAGTASEAKLAISVGGVLLAYRALKRLTGGLWQLGGAVIAWRRTSLLFHAAARKSSAGYNERASPASGDLLRLDDVFFRYPNRADPVLRGCNLRMAQGDRLLLEGPSGGGKSTLAAVITGLRQPDSGSIALAGTVVSAPQFHENHVLTGPFAFNLMMGYRWPPLPGDFEELESLCRELGLGELLERMPAGLLQCVGDTGWQLSHGERSRLYIARALLQKTDLVVLDESFAALDPENLRRALECVLARTKSLIVIAHP